MGTLLAVGAGQSLAAAPGTRAAVGTGLGAVESVSLYGKR